jgi:hypothetical protein
MSLLPGKRPDPTPEYVDQLFRAAGVTRSPAILGRRGYFDQLGVPGINDTGIYDDAIFVRCAGGRIVGFNANTDPSDLPAGRATLQAGSYLYAIGDHHRTDPDPKKRYKALIQSSPVTILRQGKTALEHGFYGINIHRGGDYTTGSEGCQTIYKPQWQEFIDLVQWEMTKAKVPVIPYVLSVFKPAAK